MDRDTPLSADQDVLVDANIFYAIGRPSNPQYHRFRTAVQHAGVVCKLPRRVIGELGGPETDRVRTALDEGWAEIIDAPSPTDGDAVAASDIARRTVASKSPRGQAPRLSRGLPFYASVEAGGAYSPLTFSVPRFKRTSTGAPPSSAFCRRRRYCKPIFLEAL
mgnify:CR=1 FL=1